MDAAIFQYGFQFRRKQLEDLMTDCASAYEAVMSCGEIIKNDENTIRDKLAEYLEDDEFKNNNTLTVKNFHVDHEVPEGQHGRVDFRFLQVNPYEGEKVYYIIECKRLDGSGRLNKEYVDRGINRFKTKDKYSTRLGVNGMIGFLVRPLDVLETCGNINTYLLVEEKLISLPDKTTSGCFDFESSHDAPFGRITLLHLWMNFSSMIE